MFSNNIFLISKIKIVISSVIVAFSILTPSISHAAKDRINLTCEVDGVYGPDGQPNLVKWSIDLRNKQACLLPECSLKAQVQRATNDDIWLEFPLTAGGTQLFKIKLGTGEFLWSVAGAANEYRGTCRETPSGK